MKIRGLLLTIFCIVFVIKSTVLQATELRSGFYLKWNTDHTERKIRPVYPITAQKASQYNGYQIQITAQKPENVCYFALGKPANSPDFGTHCLTFRYQPNSISLQFFDLKGTQVNNNQGVYRIVYLLEGQRYATKKQNLNQAGELVVDKTGTAEYYFKRDKLGRLNSEIRKDTLGQVVPEHNGFYEARFDFDDNDYAKFRKGYDKSGQIMEGKYGYASANFWFDEHGNFQREEFRNAKSQLVIGPSNRYAKIEYKHTDEFGNWHEINLFDENNQLLSGSPAILKATYNKNTTRKSIHYYSNNMTPMENANGVHRYSYFYDGIETKRQGYSLKNKLVQ